MLLYFSADYNAVEYVGRRPAWLAVLAVGPLTSQGRELARRVTRATQKVQEAGPMRSKSKGKARQKSMTRRRRRHGWKG
jgi:hypothetical protein